MAAAHAMPIFDEQEIGQLAQRFAEAIPEGVLSVRFVSPIILVSVPMHRALQFASLEKYLLENKRRPRECVQEVTKCCDAVQLKAVVTGKSYYA